MGCSVDTDMATDNNKTLCYNSVVTVNRTEAEKKM